jgi:hypothetical protein
MNLMLKTSVLACTGAALGVFLSVSAFALPAAPVDSKAASDVILAAEGCGPGFHRGRFDRCVPNEPPHRICPRGWHFSPFRDRCVRD